MIAADIKFEAFTISGAAMFGRMWWPMIRGLVAPRARAAWTKSRSRTARVDPRARRAKPGVETIAIAMIAFVRLFLRMVLMISARIRPKANSASMIRIRTSSSRPPW